MTTNCPLCHATLSPVDDAMPAFCGNCGLPQLRVAEEALSEPASASASSPDVSGTIDWPRALRMLSVAALLGSAVPALLPGALSGGIAGGLALLMMPALTLGVVFLYCQARPGRTISTAEGTRMGALLGLLTGSATALLAGIAGFVLRYGYRSHALDDTMRQAMAQVMSQISASSPPPELIGFLQSPEFRAGSFLMGHVISLLLLVLVGSVCGWMAATLMRSRRQRETE